MPSLIFLKGEIILNIFLKAIDNVKMFLILLTNIILVLMTLILFLAVLSRYLFSYSFTWIDAFSRYLLIYLSFIGGSIALHEGAHMGLNIIIDAFPNRIRRVIKNVNLALIIFMAIEMFLNGLKLMSDNSNQIVPEFGLLEIKKSYIYFIFPLSAFLYILISLGLMFSKNKKNFNKSLE